MIRRLIFIAIFLFGSVSSFAQQKYLRLYERKNFAKLNEVVYDALNSDDLDLDALIGATLLHYDEESYLYDLKKAYGFHSKSKMLFDEIKNSSRINKLAKLQITASYFDQIGDSIIVKSLKELRANPSEESCIEYLNTYTSIPLALRLSVEKLQHEIALRQADSTQTLANYQQFIDRYPLAEQYATAVDKRDSLRFIAAKQSNQLQTLQEFITTFPLSKYRKEAMELRQVWLADQIVEKRNQTLETKDEIKRNVKSADEKRELALYTEAGSDVTKLTNFIDKYPLSPLATIARNTIIDLAWENALRIRTSNSFKSFLSQYPHSIYAQVAKEELDHLQVKDTFKSSSASNAYDLLRKNPAGVGSSSLVDSIIHDAYRRGDNRYLRQGISDFEGEIQKRFFEANFYLVTLDGERFSLDSYFSDPYYEVANKRYSLKRDTHDQLAQMAVDLHLNARYVEADSAKYEQYIHLAKGKELSFVAVQRIIERDIEAKNWKSAIAKVEKYLYYLENSGSYYDLISPTMAKLNELHEILVRPTEKSVHGVSLGEPINTFTGGEYSPTISADGQTLYFVGKYRENNLAQKGDYVEDVFVSKRLTDTTWQKPVVVPELSTASTNEAIMHVSLDGSNLVLFRNGKMMSAQNSIAGWANLTSIAGDINTGSWQSDANLTSDNQAIFFASIRPENVSYGQTEFSSFHGDQDEYASDIYVAVKNKDGSWGKSINLGPTINTKYNERSPYLHSDLKTLYFSSSGHGGLGKLDLYKSTRLSDSCWTCWSKPVNLGKELNTGRGEWAFKLTMHGDSAYYSHWNGAEDDLYRTAMPVAMRPEDIATIQGKLLDRENHPMQGKIIWEDLETNKIMGETITDPSSGSYIITLPMGKFYGYYVSKDGYYPLSDHIDLRYLNETMDITKDFNMLSIEEMQQSGIPVIAKNLFFDTGKSAYSKASKSELDRLVELLKSYDGQVEISGFTDDVGDKATNLKLSKKRADAMKDYLVKNGIDPKRIILKYNGEANPKFDNRTPEGRAANRRVEIRLIPNLPDATNE